MKDEHDPVPLLLRGFNLTRMAALYPEACALAGREGWSPGHLLRHLCEAEAAHREQNRLVRLLRESCLPSTKTLASLDLERLPAKPRRQLPQLLEGGFLERSENILCFGLPGRGKTHYLAALGRELILRHQKRVLFITTHKLVTQLLSAKRDLKLPNQIARLLHFDAIVLDDLGYVQQTQEEMEALFTFFSECYERRSLLISSNLVFSQWDQIFKNPMTTLAAIDRLVHHSLILEFDGESRRAPKTAATSAAQPRPGPAGPGRVTPVSPNP